MKNHSTIRCPGCFEQIPETADACEHCDYDMEPTAPKTFFGKVKRALGVDLSSDIVAIHLEDHGRFFSKQEIDFLLKMEDLTILALNDVPGWDSIFYNSKRVNRPLSRK